MLTRAGKTRALRSEMTAATWRAMVHAVTEGTMPPFGAKTALLDVCIAQEHLRL